MIHSEGIAGSVEVLRDSEKRFSYEFKMHIFALVVEVCFAYKAASLRVLHLRLSASLSPLIHSLRRQKLISPDICFQSEASPVLFPLCKPAIKGINLRAGEEPRENIPESAFCLRLVSVAFSPC